MFLRRGGREARLRERIEELERELARRDARLVEVFGANADEVFERTGRLALLGTLAGGIGHELNGPLGSIVVSSELGLMHIDEVPEPQRETLRAILEQHLGDARRAGRITRDLLGLVRGGPEQRSAADLNPVVASALDQTRRLVRTEVELELELAADPLVVEHSPGQIELLVINLVVNALDPEVGASRLRVQTLGEDASACIRVADDGGGVPEPLRERIFEALYTSRPGRGTGLGLSLCRSIALAHGGQIALEPGAEGAGASFLVRLPLAGGSFSGHVA